MGKNCFSQIKMKMGINCIPSSLSTAVAALALITGNVVQYIRYKEFIKSKSDAEIAYNAGEYEINQGDEDYAKVLQSFLHLP